MSDRTIEEDENEVFRRRRQLSEALKRLDEAARFNVHESAAVNSPYSLVLECVALGFHIGQLVIETATAGRNAPNA